MEPNDRDGAGEEQRPARKTTRKRAPSARKRALNAVNAAEAEQQQNGDGSAAAAPDAAETQQGDGQSPGAIGRATADLSTAGAAMGDQPGAQEDAGSAAGDVGYGNGDADRAAESAADLKSWMDTRPEDRDTPREVL